MVTLEGIKLYLHIPYHSDDGMLEEFIKMAYSYLKTAVDDFDAKYNGTYEWITDNTEDFVVKADFLARCIVQNAYEDREQMSGTTVRVNYLVRSILGQLESMR